MRALPGDRRLGRDIGGGEICQSCLGTLKLMYSTNCRVTVGSCIAKLVDFTSTTICKPNRSSCRQKLRDHADQQHYRVIHRMIGVHPSKMQILAESLIRTPPSHPGSQEDEAVEESFDDDAAPCDRPEFADATDYATPTPGTHACPACQKTFGNPYDLVRVSLVWLSGQRLISP